MAGAEGFEPPLAVLETAGLPLNLRPWVILILLDFLVGLMLAAMTAKLTEFDAFRRSLLVLGRRIVPVLALRALERYDFPHYKITPL